MSNLQIIKSNALVEASYRLTLYEQRIILSCISQVRRNQPLTDQHLYTIRAVDLARLPGLRVERVYGHMKDAAEKLFSRRVMLHQTPTGEAKKPVLITRWVQSVSYDEKAGSVSLRFGTDMVPYLSQLTGFFTHYFLSDVAALTSVYAIRLYELLMQWKDVKKREVSIDWLRDAFQLEGKHSAMRDLKRNVLEPAVKQINDHSSLWVKYTQKKTGRKITHLVFTFGEKKKKPEKQGELNLGASDEAPHIPTQEQVARYKEHVAKQNRK